jgi:hypothetical protein
MTRRRDASQRLPVGAPGVLQAEEGFVEESDVDRAVASMWIDGEDVAVFVASPDLAVTLHLDLAGKYLIPRGRNRLHEDPEFPPLDSNLYF